MYNNEIEYQLREGTWRCLGLGSVCENGNRQKMPPPIKLLLWWANYFHVSLDYLCCRTDKPQGDVYAGAPEWALDNALRRFIGMCFDPKSTVCKRLKSDLMEAVESRVKQPPLAKHLEESCGES